MGIIKIGQLLKINNLDISKRINLVRHKDTREKQLVNGNEIVGNPYDWYRNDKNTFMAYQSEQHRDVFKDVDYIVSFIGESSTTARFIGVYEIDKSKTAFYSNKFHYKMSEVLGFDELKERVIIEWGQATLSWHQWLDKNDKEVIEITPGLDYIFPGYSQIIITLGQMQNIIIEKEYPEWKKMLSSFNCIYIISDKSKERVYIGSTYNQEGIWKRWKEYAQTNGHGNNVELKKIYEEDNSYLKKNFTWSILEILPIGISNNEAIKKETLYKQKLGKCVCSLNNN